MTRIADTFQTIMRIEHHYLHGCCEHTRGYIVPEPFQAGTEDSMLVVHISSRTGWVQQHLPDEPLELPSDLPRP